MHQAKALNKKSRSSTVVPGLLLYVLDTSYHTKCLQQTTFFVRISTSTAALRQFSIIGLHIFVRVLTSTG